MDGINGTGTSPTSAASSEPTADPPTTQTDTPPPPPPPPIFPPPAQMISDGMSEIGAATGTHLFSDLGHVAWGVTQIGIGIVEGVAQTIHGLLEDDPKPPAATNQSGDSVDDYAGQGGCL